MLTQATLPPRPRSFQTGPGSPVPSPLAGDQLVLPAVRRAVFAGIRFLQQRPEPVLHVLRAAQERRESGSRAPTQTPCLAAAGAALPGQRGGPSCVCSCLRLGTRPTGSMATRRLGLRPPSSLSLNLSLSPMAQGWGGGRGSPAEAQGTWLTLEQQALRQAPSRGATSWTAVATATAGPWPGAIQGSQPLGWRASDLRQACGLHRGAGQ